MMAKAGALLNLEKGAFLERPQPFLQQIPDHA
jgi:hypothetical protein